MNLNEVVTLTLFLESVIDERACRERKNIDNKIRNSHVKSFFPLLKIYTAKLLGEKKLVFWLEKLLITFTTPEKNFSTMRGTTSKNNPEYGKREKKIGFKFHTN